MSAGGAKELRKLIRRLERAGCTWTQRRNSHGLITLPDGSRYFCSLSPSDCNAARAIERDLKRRFGFTLEDHQ